ncbi:MAG: iron uptake porin [Xenococcaceae cyanobacterium MO_188.B32]|nr:iron uptake porin [Xenococcaceae cyanobacterium MO_188.B32]
MLKNQWTILGLSSLVLSWISGLDNKAIASEIELKNSIQDSSPEKILLEQLEYQYSPTLQPSAQINSVFQLRDVSPEDWAYEALRSLIERYNCIAGFPNGTYQGERVITRYEFAAGLNSCLQQIERLIAASETVLEEDILTLQRLVREFEAELATIGTRLDNLEGRTAFLEDSQFSTTTKLIGEAVFSASGAFGNEKANSSGEDIEDQIVFNNRVRLNFNTTFTGKDLLQVRLDALNTVPFGTNVTGTNMTRLAFERNTNNSLVIGKLFYRFPVTEKLRFHVDATRGRFNLNASNNFNKLFASPITGSISRFGRFNPIYIQGAGGTGVTAVYDFSDSVSLTLGYLARNANNSDEGNGLFNGSYAALGQLAVKPIDNLDIGLTYVRAYYPQGQAFVSGLTGSRLANTPFGQVATSTDHFGVQSSFHISSAVTLSGWVGLTLANAETNGVGFNGANVEQDDEATIFNWAITLGVPDFGKEGSLAGLVIGNPPRVTSNDSNPENKDIPWHLEGFYRYPVTDNISINPGLLVVINPEGDNDNETIYVGTIRTVFKF